MEKTVTQDTKKAPRSRITGRTVRSDFNDLRAVVHYTRAAHELGLWESEKQLIKRFFPDHAAPLIEAGCGAGRVTLGLWTLGFKSLTAFDFAQELVDQAVSLVQEREAESVTIFRADATRLRREEEFQQLALPLPYFQGALFMFNGLMQIPGRARRRAALRELHAVCRPDAPLLFTTHDREDSRLERALWKLEKVRWETGAQDPRLIDFGDRYFEDEAGRTFMHLPTRAEIIEDLESTGWRPEYDAMRRTLARESKAVRDFSDECRFWVARRGRSGRDE